MLCARWAEELKVLVSGQVRAVPSGHAHQAVSYARTRPRAVPAAARPANPCWRTIRLESIQLWQVAGQSSLARAGALNESQCAAWSHVDSP